MDKYKKNNIIGNVAIICGIVAWFLSLIDFVLNSNPISLIVLSLMIVHISLRDKYIEVRKEEIDKLLQIKESKS